MVSKDISKVFSSFHLVDFIPQLAWIDVIRGAPRKAKTLAENIHKLFEVAIEEKLAKMDSQKVDDHELGEGMEPVIDALLRLHQDDGIGFSLERDVVKALLMDSYLAGLESTSTLLEWVMAELLTHPSALKKLQAEVRMIVNGSRQHITGDDIEQMKYLKAVIMETFRLHPPFSIPFPQVAMHDVNVMGFDIAKGTTIYINVWAIGRDPKVWDRPNEFVPDRFVGSSMDFVKHDFKLLPFGAGRRICPGEGLALTIAENLLANLLCKFDWALPEGVKEDDMDMNETTGIATHKKSQLLAFAKPL